MFADRKRFDDFMDERLSRLAEFAGDIGINPPSLVVAEPESVLQEIDMFMSMQSVEDGDFAWIVGIMAVFVGELLVRRFGGYWLICDEASSRLLGRIVVKLCPSSPTLVLVDPFEVSGAFVSEAPPRSLARILDEVSEGVSRAMGE